jgi:tRNA dimethylallyltransferase
MSPLPSTDKASPIVPVLVGPTASGKTPVALQIARDLGAEIISADSRQVYKLMDIGTAKPTPGERAEIRHHFIDEILPDEDFNAGEFGRKGRAVIDDIFRRGKIPLVAGGSGLYIQSLVDGFFAGPASDDAIRQKLNERLRNEGAVRLLDELRLIDPDAAASMIPANTRRIIRALEVYQLTGIPLTELHRSNITIPFRPLFAGLQWERSLLYERINRRTGMMIRCGLVDEVKRLKREGYSASLNALQTVGYKEVFDFLEGGIDESRMVNLIRQNSRHYAKRQLTWFRRDARIRWFECASENDLPEVASRITAYFSQSLTQR